MRGTACVPLSKWGLNFLGIPPPPLRPRWWRSCRPAAGWCWTLKEIRLFGLWLRDRCVNGPFVFLRRSQTSTRLMAPAGVSVLAGFESASIQFRVSAATAVHLQRLLHRTSEPQVNYL
eukprot:2942874-Prymnesium_polylepis.1